MGGPGSGPRPRGGRARDAGKSLPVVAPPGGFAPARFVGYLMDGTMRFDRNGALMLTFVVPKAGVEEALGLRQFLGVQVPLEVGVAASSGWAADVAATEARRSAREGAV